MNNFHGFKKENTKFSSSLLIFLTSDLKTAWIASISFLPELGNSATKETAYTEYMINTTWSNKQAY